MILLVGRDEPSSWLDELLRSILSDKAEASVAARGVIRAVRALGRLAGKARRSCVHWETRLRTAGSMMGAG